MTEYTGTFMVGDGVPAWVVPVTFQDGRCVVDHRNGDNRGLDHAYAALAASGEPLRGGLEETLDRILDRAYDGFSDDDIVSIQWIGDVVLIFCSLRQMQQVQVEVWQRECEWIHKRNRVLDLCSLPELKALCKARGVPAGRTKLDMIFALQQATP